MLNRSERVSVTGMHPDLIRSRYANTTELASLWSHERRIIWVNPAIERAFGCRTTDVINMDASKIWHSGFVDRVWASMTIGLPVSSVGPIRAPDREVWAMGVFFPHPGGQVVAVGRDITGWVASAARDSLSSEGGQPHDPRRPPRIGHLALAGATPEGIATALNMPLHTVIVELRRLAHLAP